MIHSSIYIKIICGLLVVAIWPSLCLSTEKKPWLGNSFEFEFRPSVAVDHYTRIDTKHGTVKKNSYSTLMNLSLSMAILDSFSAEFELLTAKTPQQAFIPSDFRATGRYWWLDDIMGDPISLVIGYTLIAPFKNSRRDLSLWYHGDISSEIHLSIGKEFSCIGSYYTWDHRMWLVSSLGIGHGGAPWVGFEAHAEKQFCEENSLDAFVRTLWGLGHRKLDLSHSFPGYGSIHHQSVDVGLCYYYNIPFWATLSAEYLCRVYGRNFPKNNQRLTLTLLVPFSF